MLLISLLIVPMVLGNVITCRLDRLKDSIIADWVFGMVIMFAHIQLIAVPLIIKDSPFHVLYNIVLVLWVLETIIIAIIYRNNIIDKLKKIPLSFKNVGILGIIVLLSICIQAGILTYFQHTDDDDARFVPSAVAAVEKDIMFEENPITGAPLYSRVSEVLKDMVSPWIMFYAVISKISNIHPAILIHSVIPMFFIPLAYGVYWMLAKYLFEEEARRVVFTGIVSGINIFSGYSVYNSGAFLLFRIWQGKALFASVFAPLLLLVAINLFRNNSKRIDYMLVFITSLGACMTSGFGIVLSALFFGIISLIYGIYNKSVKKMLYVLMMLIPCVIYGYLYAYGVLLFI